MSNEGKPYTEADLPPLSWACIRVSEPGDMYIRHKFGYWREASTGKDISTAEIINRINAPGWVTGSDGVSVWCNHIGFRELVER